MSEAATSRARIAELVAPLRSDPAASAVLCDIDGTLAPIVDDPSAARVPAETRGALSALVGRYAIVACITGRRAVDARVIVGVEGVTFVGNHGFETMGPGASEPRPDPALAGRENLARRFLDDLDRGALAEVGLRREDKGAIQTLHWRGASERAARGGPSA